MRSPIESGPARQRESRASGLSTNSFRIPDGQLVLRISYTLWIAPPRWIGKALENRDLQWLVPPTSQSRMWKWLSSPVTETERAAIEDLRCAIEASEASSARLGPRRQPPHEPDQCGAPAGHPTRRR